MHSSAYQAEIGRRVLRDRYGLVSYVIASDFLRPIGLGLAHSYTFDDGRLSIEA